MIIKLQYEQTIDNLNQILELLGKTPIMDEETRNQLITGASEEKNKLLGQYCRLQ